jgi:hypothetical protein
MLKTFLFAIVTVCLSVPAAAEAAADPAQTKISGTVQCGKADEQLILEVGDQPQHFLMVSRGKCTWTRPMEIAGTRTKEDIGTGFDEINGNRSHGHGYVVGTLDNGDTMYVRTQGSATLKNGLMERTEGTWSFTGGTGNLKGIKGKGTYKGRGTPDGSVTYEVEGEYELPK